MLSLLILAAIAASPSPSDSSGVAARLLPTIQICASTLRNQTGIPASSGWKPTIHMSGTPFAVEGMKRKDMAAMLAGMRHTRQFYSQDNNPGRLTRYFAGGTYFACEAALPASPQEAAAMRDDLVASLGLREITEVSQAMAEFGKQYLIGSMTEAFKKDGSTYVVHYGAETASTSAVTAQPALSVFVF